MPSPDTASLASRIFTSRPTYAEKLQGYKNLSPRSNTLPLAGHANTSLSLIRSSKKNLTYVFSGHWPLFLNFFFVDISAIFCTVMQISLRIRHRRQSCARCTLKMRFPPGRSRPIFPAEDKSSVHSFLSTHTVCRKNPKA